MNLLASPPPPGQTCEQYVQPFISQAGGYVQVESRWHMRVLSVPSGDEFGNQFSVYYSHIWRDFGIVLGVHLIFDYAVVFFATWLRSRGRVTSGAC